jgi:hypothetical protein
MNTFLIHLNITECSHMGSLVTVTVGWFGTLLEDILSVRSLYHCGRQEWKHCSIIFYLCNFRSFSCKNILSDIKQEGRDKYGKQGTNQQQQNVTIKLW